jgi:hypothetical protein
LARSSGPCWRGAGNGAMVLTAKNLPLIIFKLRHHCPVVSQFEISSAIRFL